MYTLVWDQEVDDRRERIEQMCPKRKLVEHFQEAFPITDEGRKQQINLKCETTWSIVPNENKEGRKK